MGGCGVALIALGIALDLRDPTRTGAWHEWAMWLFVVGSPLAVHPMFVTVIRDRVQNGFSEGGMIALVLALAFIVSFVGLLLDRRSLVTSSLIYLASAFGYLLFRSVGDPISLLGIIPLIIGVYVILLGVAWQPIRRTVLHNLPGQAILQYLPRYS
jgi:drug/metabolite transporter (DMT)-like permease